MNHPKWLWVGLTLAVLLLNGCGEKPKGNVDSNTAATVTSTPIKTNPLADPGEIRTFLSNKGVPNGDIYLQDEKVHVNIVGLNEEIQNVFAERYVADTYVLHNVEYTIQELEAAQKLLEEHNLYLKQNVYGSSIDVIGNRLAITMPDSSETTAKPEIEKLIDPNMVSYTIEKLGQPHVVGEIVEVESINNHLRILILEPGKDVPTYWFSFNDRSELYNEAEKEIHLSDLEKGQQVKLWGTGTVLESLPAQATVRRLEVDMSDL
ncbi:MAG: YobA family protein [Paenibacillus sp.]|nr:YobA family protein [Paenibacillus sp.]